ncbi:hypothetical protein EYF80_032511 [Liparis tanakae]|uniref:Uncharacterized protein n=1 Tax=Liparis tanakae TaxID=230148 RepID=A0A4Z2GX07_9TELE|nr:hypothetical protein EYF80_032511 [Liparis tanakae]
MEKEGSDKRKKMFGAKEREREREREGKRLTVAVTYSVSLAQVDESGGLDEVIDHRAAGFLALAALQRRETDGPGYQPAMAIRHVHHTQSEEGETRSQCLGEDQSDGAGDGRGSDSHGDGNAPALSARCTIPSLANEALIKVSRLQTAGARREARATCSDVAEWQRPDDTQPQWQGLG